MHASYTKVTSQAIQHISAGTNAGYKDYKKANCKQQNIFLYMQDTRVTSLYAYRLQGYKPTARNTMYYACWLQANCKQYNI